MKKFLLIAIITFITGAVEAQVSLLGANGLAIDTVSDTGAKILTKIFTGSANAVTIQVNCTKISGTVGGTLTPIASNDGVTFYSVADVATVSRDTAVTLSNVASQGFNYNMPIGYKYYGVKWTGTGTMSGSFSAKLYYTNAGR